MAAFPELLFALALAFGQVEILDNNCVRVGAACLDGVLAKKAAKLQGWQDLSFTLEYREQLAALFA